jgi:hypothetical protein
MYPIGTHLAITGGDRATPSSGPRPHGRGARRVGRTERDAILWWPLGKAIGGEADHAEAARRRRRRVEVEAAIAAGRHEVAAGTSQ